MATSLKTATETLDTDSETEDEVTFLLRLRPTTSPPARRRRHSVDCRPVSQTSRGDSGWDVVIQRHDVTSPSSPPPPPLPPRVQPSAPPPEEPPPYNCYPKQEPFFNNYQQHYMHPYQGRLRSEFSVSFPNLKYLDGPCGPIEHRYAPVPVVMSPNNIPLPPKPDSYGTSVPIVAQNSGQFTNYSSANYMVNGVQNQFQPSGNFLARNYAKPPLCPPPQRPPKPLPRTHPTSTPLESILSEQPRADNTIATVRLAFIYIYLVFLACV